MSLLRSFLSLSLPAAACGCSAVVIEPSGTEPAPSEPVAPAVEPAPARAAFCGSELLETDTTHAVVAVSHADLVRLVRQDGTEVGIPPLSSPAASGDTTLVSVASGGGVVVIAGRVLLGGSLADARTTVTWVKRSGEVITTLDVDEDLSPVAVGPDGTSVLHKYVLGGPSTYLVRLPTGELTEHTGFDPMGAPLTGGWLAVTNATDVGGFGFFHVPTQGLLGLSPMAAGASPQRLGGGVAYLSSGKSVPWLVLEEPGTQLIHPLWEVALEGEDVWLLGMTPSRALVQDGQTAAMWLAEVETGAAARADLLPPAPLVELQDSCQLVHRSLASSGVLVAPVRDGGGARVMLHDPMQASWTPLGLPVAAPGTVEIMESGGTYVVHAGDASDTFCPIIDWTGVAPEGSLPVRTTQIVRPAAGAVQVLEEDLYPWTVSLHPTGTCAAIPREDGWDVLDVVTGERSRLATPAEGFLWL